MKLKTDLNSTVLIGRIISMYLLVTGIGFSISTEYYANMIAYAGSDPILINLSGMVHFFIGATILVVHFKWKKPLQIVVSLLGIMFLMKGISLIALPEFVLQSGNNPVQIPELMSVGFILIGCAIGYFSFFERMK